MEADLQWGVDPLEQPSRLWNVRIPRREELQQQSLQVRKNGDKPNMNLRTYFISLWKMINVQAFVIMIQKKKKADTQVEYVKNIAWRI